MEAGAGLPARGLKGIRAPCERLAPREGLRCNAAERRDEAGDCDVAWVSKQGIENPACEKWEDWQARAFTFGGKRGTIRYIVNMSRAEGGPGETFRGLGVEQRRRSRVYPIVRPEAANTR